MILHEFSIFSLKHANGNFSPVVESRGLVEAIHIRYNLT